MTRLRTSLLALALSAAALAQTPSQVGVLTVAWPGGLPLGSPNLLATVRYPAATSGGGGPVLPHPNGWPVVVLLHGLGWLGQDYGALADAFVAEGFVVVAADTCQWDWVCQEHDGRALHGALVAANADPADPLFGVLDTTRIALVGHSMGGSSIAQILVSNPGYRAAFAFAPALPLGTNADAVTVPFGVAVGVGDTITTWNHYALPYYLAVANHGSFKSMTLMGVDCDHMNLAGLVPPPWSSTTATIFDRSVRVGAGFLRHAMAIDPTALDQVLGGPSLNDPNMVFVQREVLVPQMWFDQVFHIGQPSRVSVALDGLIAALLASGSLIPPVPTPYGVMAIDPGTTFLVGLALLGVNGTADFALVTPADPQLVGLSIAVQAITDSSADLTFSNAWLVPTLP